jgi:hypothetical protein
LLYRLEVAGVGNHHGHAGKLFKQGGHGISKSFISTVARLYSCGSSLA